MSRHRRGTLIIRPLTVREVDTTGLEPQSTLLRSGLLGIDDVAALEESGALRRLVDAGVFDDQRILNLFYRLITPPPNRAGVEGKEHRRHRLAHQPRLVGEEQGGKEPEAARTIPVEMRGRVGTARSQSETAQGLGRPYRPIL